MKISNLLFTCGSLIACAAVAAITGCNGSGTQLPPSGSYSSVAQQASSRLVDATPHRYFVIDIGTLGGTQATAEGISDRDWVVGTSTLLGNQVGRAFLWRHGSFTDLGTLGGKNSQEQWAEKDKIGVVAGDAETAHKDPSNEDFCGFDSNNGVQATGLICKPFMWKGGVMGALRTLGGPNGQATGVNDLGEIVGIAETATRDPNCAAPQVYDAGAVVWGPQRGKIHTLPPLRHDVMAWAIGINDHDQIAGVSGKCTSPNFNGNRRFMRHGVIWENGAPKDLGNLGGSKGTLPWAINESGQIVGQSYVSNNAAYHAFLWESGVIDDLGTLYPDLDSVAFGENDRGYVVGGSALEGVPRAFIWHRGVMTDVNTLIADGSDPDYLFFANDVNERGEISFYAFNTVDHADHAAIGIPCSEVPKRCGKGNLQIVAPAEMLSEMFKRLRVRP